MKNLDKAEKRWRKKRLFRQQRRYLRLWLWIALVFAVLISGIGFWQNIIDIININ